MPATAVLAITAHVGRVAPSYKVGVTRAKKAFR